MLDVQLEGDMENFTGELDTMQIQINKDAYECCICYNVFTSPVQLTVHCIVLHWLLPCNHCLKLFQSEDLLSDHINLHHSIVEHICTDCSSSFKIQDEFFAHISREHSKISCAYCSRLISHCNYTKHMTDAHKAAANSEIRLTIEPKSENEFICIHCHDEKSMKSLDKLFFHYLYFHKYSLQSLIQCILNDNSMDSLKAPNSDDDVNAKCSKCGLTYTLSTPKIYHQIYCHGFIYCDICKQCFDDQAKFDEHSLQCCDKPKMLSFCDDCINVNGFFDETHVHAVHEIPPNAKWTKFSSLLNAQNDCNFCGMDLDSEASCLLELLAHYRILHKFNAIAILRYLKPSPIEKKSVETKEQGSKRSGQNVTEIRVVDGEDVEYLTSFDTKVVRYVFSSDSDYDSSDAEEAKALRIVTIHQCDLCSSQFKSKYVHAMHMNTMHGFTIKMPESRCNVCSKVFASNRTLKQHNKITHHKQTAENRFKCPFCAFGCNGKGRMRKHISEHVEASYHPCQSKAIGFNCRFCHFIFWTKEKLNEHQLSRHSEDLSETYLLCSLCYESFINLVSL